MTRDKSGAQAFLQGDDRFEVLTQVLPQLIWWTDKDGAANYATSRTLDYFGERLEALAGEGWIAFVHPEERESTRLKWAEGVNEQALFEFEHRLRRYDGEHIVHLTRGMPVFDAGGALSSFIRTSTDISMQKRADHALRQAEKLAAVGKLATSISHEINNPLESVMNLLYLLAGHGSLDRTAREYVKTAQEELARISEITTQTLRFHQQSTNAAPTRIADVLDSVLAFYKPRMEAGGLRLFREYRSTEPLVCSAGEIRQLLANIVGNAIDAMTRGGRLRVRLRTSRDWKTRQKLGIRITIGDTGRGISVEDRERIFEPFFTTKGINGTGLGLWITKDLLRKHDGMISLRSSTKAAARAGTAGAGTAEAGTGTVMSLYLPFEWVRPGDGGSEGADRVEGMDAGDDLALKFI